MRARQQLLILNNPGGGGASVYVFDEFERTGNLVGSTPSPTQPASEVWQVFDAGDPAISGGKVGTGATGRSFIDISVSDNYRLTENYGVATVANGGFIMRAADGNNGNVFFLVANTLKFWDRIAGTWTERATKAVTLPVGEYAIQADVVGNSHTLTANGDTLEYTTSANAGNTGVGLAVGGDVASTVDNFKAVSL